MILWLPHRRFHSQISFLFETSTVKIAKVTNSPFWTILAKSGGFSVCSTLKIVSLQSLFSKNSSEYPEATDKFWIKTSLK